MRINLFLLVALFIKQMLASDVLDLMLFQLNANRRRQWHHLFAKKLIFWDVFLLTMPTAKQQLLKFSKLAKNYIKKPSHFAQLSYILIWIEHLSQVSQVSCCPYYHPFKCSSINILVKILNASGVFILPFHFDTFELRKIITSIIRPFRFYGKKLKPNKIAFSYN